MFLNLLKNAIDAMEEGGRLGVAQALSGEQVEITIRDNGCGIPDEDKTKLFEPYFSTKKAGTGLVLAIVNAIISDHNGYIRVRDNHPTGTKFIIDLPLQT